MDPIPKIISGLRHIARELSIHSRFIQDHFIEQIRLMDPLEVDKILWAIDILTDMLQIASVAEQKKTPSPQK